MKWINDWRYFDYLFFLGIMLHGASNFFGVVLMPNAVPNPLKLHLKICEMSKFQVSCCPKNYIINSSLETLWCLLLFQIFLVWLVIKFPYNKSLKKVDCIQMQWAIKEHFCSKKPWKIRNSKIFLGCIYSFRRLHEIILPYFCLKVLIKVFNQN